MPRGHIQYTFTDKEEYILDSIENELRGVDDSVKILRSCVNQNTIGSRNHFKITFENESNKEVDKIEADIKKKIIELNSEQIVANKSRS